MRSWRALVLAVAIPLTIGLARGAWGTVGGPQLVEPLGWDSASSRVYFRIYYVDESNEEPTCFYFNLGRKDPARLVKVPPGTRTLEHPLRALKTLVTPTIPRVQAVLGVDTLQSCDQSWPRYRVAVSDLQLLGEGNLVVVTIGNPRVVIPRQYAIPGRSERIGIAAFFGIPCEMGYEVQVPFLIPGSHETRQVEAFERPR